MRRSGSSACRPWPWPWCAWCALSKRRESRSAGFGGSRKGWRGSRRITPSMYRGRTGTSAFHSPTSLRRNIHSATLPRLRVDRQRPKPIAQLARCHPRRHPAHAADPHAACCDACDADCGMMCRAAVLSPICMEPSSYGCETMCGHAFCTLCLSTYWKSLPQGTSRPLNCPYCRRQGALPRRRIAS